MTITIHMSSVKVFESLAWVQLPTEKLSLEQMTEVRGI